jgi:hypothetical protein
LQETFITSAAKERGEEQSTGVTKNTEERNRYNLKDWHYSPH